MSHHLETEAPPGRERALVLGGGGAAGNAWEIGVIAGLFDAGLDVTDADLIVGTSAGSTVAAQITGTTRPPELLAAILTEPRPAASSPPSTERAAGADYMQKTAAVMAGAVDPADMRRRLGEAALGGMDETSRARWRDTVASRFPARHWPQRRVIIVSVDADTGEPVLLDRDSGVDLVDAVAASSAHGYRVGDRTFINGGYRRNENADLAAGYQRVLVLSPFSGQTRHPLDWGMQLAAQVDELRAGGSRVETVFPDSDVHDLFDAHALDPSTRLPAARAGYEQGRALAQQLTALWR